MAARCEAAGRPNNEDNYQLNYDLSEDKWGFTVDQKIKLGDKGSLLVVCDGMGGMNAGEVASAIAVKTIKEYFVSEKITNDVLANPQQYLYDSILAADAAIKEHSKIHPDTEGMGSTIVIAWLLGQKLYLGWCGDSRCYRFNPSLGLERLSRDHSYVQELVDAGKLTEELAFDHPNNNIITRSLGDPRGAAQPDTKEYDLYNDDIILLCSDGLCGTLRDYEIAEQIRLHQTSMQECRDALWHADEMAGWTDNVTIALAQIISGAKDVSSLSMGPSMDNNDISESKMKLIRANKRLKRMIVSIVVLMILCLLGGVFYMYKVGDTTKKSTVDVKVTKTEDDTSVKNDIDEEKQRIEKDNKTIEVNNTVSEQIKTDNDDESLNGVQTIDENQPINDLLESSDVESPSARLPETEEHNEIKKIEYKDSLETESSSRRIIDSTTLPSPSENYGKGAQGKNVQLHQNPQLEINTDQTDLEKNN